MKKNNIKKVFNMSGKRPLIKFKGYQYIGTHDSYNGINYYIRPYDNMNNYEFMEVMIDRTGKFLPKYMVGAGTAVKVLDTFMYVYLQQRHDLMKNEDKLKNDDFIKFALKISNYDEHTVLKYYSTNVPKQIQKETNYMNSVGNGYKVLYVMNNETSKRKYAKVQICLVKEETKNFNDIDLSYVRFKLLEYVVRPSFVKGESKDKYMPFTYPDINIPTSILK